MLNANTGIKAFSKKETDVGLFLPKKIAKVILINKNMKTDSVKEGTEGIVNISSTKLAATEVTATRTFTPVEEKKKMTIWRKRTDDGQDIQEKYMCNQCDLRT